MPEKINIDSEADILTIVDGTTEAEARDKLGKKRREMTGVLARSSRVRFLTLSSKFMKPVSIINSALGLTISILLLTEQDFWSVAFYISFLVGLIVGVFFELWSTNSEHVFATDDELEIGTKDRNLYKKIIYSIKTYAVIMVLISAWNLPDYILIQKVQNVDDNEYILTRISQIERLKNDKSKAKEATVVSSIYQEQIERLEGEIKEIRAEKTNALIQNSTSKFVRKRADAKKMLASINKRIEAKNAEIAKAESKMVASANGMTQKQKYEEAISLKEEEILTERKRLKKEAGEESKSTLGITAMMSILFVFLELGGTLASILARRTILDSISAEESYKESVTNMLFDQSIALKTRNVNLKATKISTDLHNNKVMTSVINYESAIMNQNYQLEEKARLSEIDRENARLLLDSKVAELDANSTMMMVAGVKNKLKGLDSVRIQIGKVLEE